MNYVNNSTKVTIICPEHGEFEQTPSDHLLGHGCSKCIKRHSNGGLLSLGEQSIKEILDLNNIKYEILYPIKIDRSINSSGLAYIDFYLPKYNIFIEYNGIQHYVPVDYFGGKLTFEHQRLRDDFVKEYCLLNKILLFEIKYSDNVKQILQDFINTYCSVV